MRGGQRATPERGNIMLRFLHASAMRWLLLLGCIEWLLIAALFLLALQLRFSYDPGAIIQSIPQPRMNALVFGAVLVIGMTAMGLYQPHMREYLRGAIARLASGMGMGTAGLALLYYFVPQVYVGRGVFALALGMSFAAVLALRSVFQVVLDTRIMQRRVLVLGSGRNAALISQLLSHSQRRGFEIVGYVPVSGETCAVAPGLLMAVSGALHVHALRERVDEILIAVEDRRGHLPMEELFRCRQKGIPVTDLATFFESESGQVMALTDPSWLVFSGGFCLSRMRCVVKRAFDLGVTAILLLLTWPLMLLVVLAILVESGSAAPILYRQVRVGRHGKPFRIVKFRSMRTDAESDGRARWAGAGDDRVTRVGRFIRKVRLDELPQLWNVLHGEMSFIGPRPERPEFVIDLIRKIRYYDARHCVKPGLTGWAQLLYPYGASENDAAQKLKYDLFYIKNQSMTLDLLILLQTVEVVLFGRGAR
jgi:sugar transferase (PEP-CTERM system associated)